MTITTTFALTVLAVALVSKSLIDISTNPPSCPSSPPTIGWIQALHAQTKSDRCFCADDKVRVLPSDTGSYAAEIIDFSPLDPPFKINLTVNEKVYQINPTISVTLRTAGGGPRKNNKTKEASACVQVCDARSPAQPTLALLDANWALDFLHYVKSTYFSE